MSTSQHYDIHPELIGDIPVEEEARSYKARKVWAVTRISLGWVFLWAFLDKTFALGFATGRDPETGIVDYFGEAAWINGGSPTTGFLQFGTEGKVFHDFFAGLAGPFADWLFMLALLGIGVSLILGIGMRIMAVSASILLISMWAAELRLDNNPFMDDHIVYALAAIGLTIGGAGRTWGLGRRWEDSKLVQRFPVLK